VFFWPLSMQPMFEEQRQNAVAYGLWPRALNLPSYHGLGENEIDRVCAIVRACLS
jgi:perosamine synthetase